MTHAPKDGKKEEVKRCENSKLTERKFATNANIMIITPTFPCEDIAFIVIAMNLCPQLLKNSVLRFLNKTRFLLVVLTSLLSSN